MLAVCRQAQAVPVAKPKLPRGSLQLCDTPLQPKAWIYQTSQVQQSTGAIQTGGRLRARVAHVWVSGGSHGHIRQNQEAWGHMLFTRLDENGQKVKLSQQNERWKCTLLQTADV